MIRSIIVTLLFLSNNNNNPLALEQQVDRIYGELACNANANPKINTDNCLNNALPLSSLLNDNNDNVVIIPCGSCYTVDYTNGETITMEGGLNVLGRLHFPSTSNIVLNTTSVLVQGMWSMTIPEDNNSIKIHLYGTDDVTIYPHDQCCNDNGVCDSECEHKANMGVKPFAVVGGQLDIRAIDTNCPSWTVLKKSDPTSKTLTVVDSSFSSCLSAGDEVVVAGDEKLNRGHAIYTVASINSDEVIVEEAFVNRDCKCDYATVDKLSEEEAMFATEITKVTRQVVFEGNEDEENIGAHSIIFHTPNVAQTIQGVSFVGFGQGGKLGRYPIHFHISNDVNGSLLSKNVVRDSHQRCYFIHNTNYVTLDDNVAYNFRGHCYATETGIEENNVFTNNIAVAGHKLLVSGNGQSDDPDKHKDPSSFWIRNMMNTFVGNRVGGSAGAGFWIEMRVKSGNQLNEDSFKDNVAHGCKIGFLTYTQGWTPSQPGHVKNMKVYKNRDGFKMHKTGNIKFTNFLSADDHLSIYGFKNDGVDFEDSLFIGLSDDARLRLDRDCPWHKDGIQAAFNTLIGEGRKQVHLKNVEFRNYNCNSRPITFYMDSRFSHWNYNMGDPFVGSGLTFTGSTGETNRPGLDCSDEYSHNWFMEDEEGTIGPSGKGAGFIIKDNDQMKAFFSPDTCETIPYNDCTTMCKNVCLRLVHIQPKGDGPFHSLKLTDQDTSTSFTYELNADDPKDKAVLVAPKGNYKGDFQDENGDWVVASNVIVSTFRPPAGCEDYVEVSDFTFETDLCGGYHDKTILDEAAEKTFTYSNHEVGDRLPAIRYRQIITENRDTVDACVTAGAELAVSFKAKLLDMNNDDSVLMDCISDESIKCPSGVFRLRQDKPGGDTYCNSWYHLQDNNYSLDDQDGEFLEVSTIYKVSNLCEGNQWKWFYFDINMGHEYEPNTVKMIVKDVMVEVLDTTVTPTVSPTFDPTSSPTAECKGWNPDTCACPNNLQKDYRGTIGVTKSGRTCMRWDSQDPHSHNFNPEDHPNDGLDENYCRNPSNHSEGAWCYTIDEDKRWEDCNVPTCYPPTNAPTNNPTDAPSAKHLTTNPSTLTPTASPTAYPTNSPTKSPTHSPVTSPSDSPTVYPTVSPTHSPTTPPVGETCNDSPLKFQIKKEKGKKKWKYCSWIDENKLCSLKHADKLCPKTCGTCHKCKDSNLKFKTESGKTKKCRWVENNTAERCTLPGISDTCRKTCNVC